MKSKEKETFLKIIKLSIILACFIFVMFQSYQCLNKFIEEPQGTTLKMVASHAKPRPVLSFCSIKKFVDDKLKPCNLSHDEAVKGKWQGNVTACGTPQEMLEDIMKVPSSLVKRVVYITENGTKVNINNDTEKWSWFVRFDFELFPKIIFCQTATLNQTIVYKEIRTQIEDGTEVYLHLPGAFLDGIMLVPGSEAKVTYDILYELFALLDYDGKPCVNEENYLVDQCMMDIWANESLKQFNCVGPIGPMGISDKICTDPEKGQQVLALLQDPEFKKIAEDKCLPSCLRMQISFSKILWAVPDDRPDLKPKYHGRIDSKFKLLVKYSESFYNYSGLSLIAEVGGYVGLFLGISIVQIIDILDWLGRTLMH